MIELNFDEGDVEFDDSGIVMAGTRWVVFKALNRIFFDHSIISIMK